MADMDALFARYAELKPAYDKLGKEMEAIKDELDRYFSITGEVLTSSDGISIRKDSRRQMNDRKLETMLGASRFRAVSKRVSVAALLKAAVLKGKIRQDELDECYDRTKPWFTIV